MIWLLLILFVPGGLNQGISIDARAGFNRQVVYPCDDTRITAELPSSTQGYIKEYNLFIPIPPSGLELDLKFDSVVALKLLKPGRKIFIKGTSHSNAFNLKFETESVKYTVLNCTIIVPYTNTNRLRIPYVRSILLNKKDQLCMHPKTGYFDNIFASNTDVPYNELFTISNIVDETTEAPDIVSTTTDEKEEDDDPNKFSFDLLMEKIKKHESDAAYNAPFTKKNKTDGIQYQPQAEAISLSLSETCGRKKIAHTALIVHGQSAKAGHWPWHVALFRIDHLSLKYICGGTLLSKTLVLTAAHCVSKGGSTLVPQAIKVYLGKHNLFFDGDVGVQEREVFQIIIHHKYKEFTMENDIALLKLKYEAVYTDYVQPACLWYEDAIYKLPHSVIFGTVVGWGFDHQEVISHYLKQITIPIVPELTCLKSNPTFFHRQLTKNTFCAGFGNGSSVCNGDSGGGLMIFVTETPGGTASGAWYVRGIVSIALKQNDKNVCDPDQYTIFTDVEKYRHWILGYFN